MTAAPLLELRGVSKHFHTKVAWPRGEKVEPHVRVWRALTRKHAVLRFLNGQWAIMNLGSTNGTYLNDAAIVPNAPVAVPDKTRIRLGNLMIFFRHITQTTRL